MGERMAISKLNLREFLKENKEYRVLQRRKNTTIIRLPNGDILKILDNDLLNIISDT